MRSLPMLSLLIACSAPSKVPVEPCATVWETDRKVQNQKDWEALACVQTLKGDLLIQESSVRRIPQLALKEIHGDLAIEGTSQLHTVDGLAQLQRVRGHVRIRNNQALHSLDGLDSLKRIGGTLHIDENPSLERLRGLRSLESIGAEGSTVPTNTIGLSIRSNPALKELSGLRKLTAVSGSVIIRGNDTLSALNGLDGLTEYSSGLHIQGNPKLTSLKGVRASSVGGELSVFGNASLKDIHALLSLQQVNGSMTVHTEGQCPEHMPALHAKFPDCECDPQKLCASQAPENVSLQPR